MSTTKIPGSLEASDAIHKRMANGLSVDGKFEQIPDSPEEFFAKYSEDQPRDEQGQFAAGDGNSGGDSGGVKVLNRDVSDSASRHAPPANLKTGNAFTVKAYSNGENQFTAEPDGGNSSDGKIHEVEISAKNPYVISSPEKMNQDLGLNANEDRNSVIEEAARKKGYDALVNTDATVNGEVSYVLIPKSAKKIAISSIFDGNPWSTLAKYSEDQPRDDKGQFAAGDGESEQTSMHATLQSHGWKEVTSTRQTERHALAQKKLEHLKDVQVNSIYPQYLKDYNAQTRVYIHPDKPGEVVETIAGDSSKGYSNWEHSREVTTSPFVDFNVGSATFLGGSMGRSGGGASKLNEHLKSGGKI